MSKASVHTAEERKDRAAATAERLGCCWRRNHRDDGNDNNFLLTIDRCMIRMDGLFVECYYSSCATITVTESEKCDGAKNVVQEP